jgi:hypothetical protein
MEMGKQNILNGMEVNTPFFVTCSELHRQYISHFLILFPKFEIITLFYNLKALSYVHMTYYFAGKSFTEKETEKESFEFAFRIVCTLARFIIS